MNKLYAWILGMTKVGKTLKKIQEYLDGKKQIIASLATAIPATLLIVQKFTDQGTPYLVGVASTPEFLAASGGWVAFFNGLGIKKTRLENAQIINLLKPSDSPK